MIKGTTYKIAVAILITAVIILSFTPRSGNAYNPTISVSAVLNFPVTNADEVSDLTVTATGATDANPVWVGIPNAAGAPNSFYVAWVSAPNQVTVRFFNIGLTPIDPPSATFRVIVAKF